MDVLMLKSGIWYDCLKLEKNTMLIVHCKNDNAPIGPINGEFW